MAADKGSTNIVWHRGEVTPDVNPFYEPDDAEQP